MRVFCVGLVGAGVIVGVAIADPVLGCRLDGLELTTEVPESHERRRFHVLKVESRFWRLHGPEVNDSKPDGYFTILNEGDERLYVVGQTYTSKIEVVRSSTSA